MKIGGVVPVYVLTVWLLVLTLSGTAAEMPDMLRRRIAILKDAAAGVDAATADAVADTLRRAKFEVAFLSAEAACDPAVLSPEKYFLYVIPNPTTYPVSGTNTLMRYLQGKGNLMILGTPVFPGQLQIETVSPVYKMYTLKDIASLKIVSVQSILSGDNLKLPVPKSVFSCYARPEGKGLDHGYKWRWIPLVKVCDKDGVERGTAIWMLLNHAPLREGAAFDDAVQRLAGNGATSPPAFEGSACAVCAIADPAALGEIARTSLLGDLARRIRDGLFLSHAGSQYFSYWPEEKVQLGAVTVNHGSQQATICIRIRVCVEGGKDAVFQKESDLTIQSGQSGTVTFDWTPASSSDRRYIVTTELLHDGKPIDVITHGLGILSTKKPAHDAFVTVKGGDFWLKGRKWYPMGVNYWPRYTVGLECEDYVYHWLSPGFYNPEEVERDLIQLESIGANFLCIRANVQHDRRNLLDFFRRCDIHGMKVFMFLQSHVITDDPHYFQGVMMPYNFQEKVVEEFIRATRLTENPTLMGYDLIWEPAYWLFGGKYSSFGWKDSAPFRQRWDKDWAKWIDDRYGSLANAETDWGIPAPRFDGAVISPPDAQFSKDGPWRVMMAAYRRFMDDLMSRKWNDATQKLRRIDPNHLVSFRQGNLPPQDFTLTATPKHIDFFCMEGYSFKPDDVGRNAAGFVNRYIHFTTKGKPYLWMEFGSSVWDRNLMQPGERAMTVQAQGHEMIYQTGLETGANGASPWWWAGGYRVSEKSDFGIINPDGTLRPSGLLLQKYAALFKKPRTYPESDIWFTMDRDAHCGGHWYFAFNEGRETFKQAAAQGHHLGIRTPGTGTTSADTPLVAVGNTKYNGKNPPKYLNAEFNWFRIKCGDGEWINVTDGAIIRVPGNKRIVAETSVGNLQEATWLTQASCNGKPGAVYLASTEDSGLKVRQPMLKDTPYLEDTEFGETFVLTKGVTAETKVELQMTAEGRAWFGEKLRFTLAME